MNISTDPTTATVHILDPDDSARAIIRRHCQRARLLVCGYQTARQLLDRLSVASVGCLVMAMCITDLHGLDVQDRLTRGGVDLPLIFVSRDADVPTVVEAMRKGAFDFFEKPFSPQLLLRRIRDAVAFNARQREKDRYRLYAVERLNRLSPKESEVVRFLIEGLGNKQIAYHLGLSVKAVEARRRRIREKLGIGNFAQLIFLVVHSRMFTLPSLIPSLPRLAV